MYDTVQSFYCTAYAYVLMYMCTRVRSLCALNEESHHVASENSLDYTRDGDMVTFILFLKPNLDSLFDR